MRPSTSGGHGRSRKEGEVVFGRARARATSRTAGDRGRRVRSAGPTSAIADALRGRPGRGASVPNGAPQSSVWIKRAAGLTPRIASIARTTPRSCVSSARTNVVGVTAVRVPEPVQPAEPRRRQRFVDRRVVDDPRIAFRDERARTAPACSGNSGSSERRVRRATAVMNKSDDRSHAQMRGCGRGARRSSAKSGVSSDTGATRSHSTG